MVVKALPLIKSSRLPDPPAGVVRLGITGADITRAKLKIGRAVAMGHDKADIAYLVAEFDRLKSGPLVGNGRLGRLGPVGLAELKIADAYMASNGANVRFHIEQRAAAESAEAHARASTRSV